MKKVIVFLFFYGWISNVQAQQYSVTYNTPGYFIPDNPILLESLTFGLSSSQETKYIDGVGTTTINGMPTQLVITFFVYEEEPTGLVVQDCSGSLTVDINSSLDCFSIDNSSYTVPLICLSGGGYTAVLNIGRTRFQVQPILSFGTNTSPSEDDDTYCEDQNITLEASYGFSNYNWQYKVDNTGWENFSPPGTDNSRTFGVQDIPETTIDILTKNIYFRYTVGNCDISTVSSPSTGAFVFNPQPSNLTLEPISSTCDENNTSSI
ncbi:MAG: hypothetical protein L3J29_12415 [Cyclobacteriaceae bacterium]|nr:hypothetical protein [Cyclobacteriaceae bacterium]